MKKLKIKYLSLAAVIAFAVAGLLQVLKATNTFAETTINTLLLSSDIYEVTEGGLPEFEIINSTEHTTVEPYGSNTTWLQWGEGHSAWHGYGEDDPYAVDDGLTHYALRILLETDDNEYVFDQNPENYTIYFNGEEYTYGHTEISINDEHSIYAIIDLGTANPYPIGPVGYMVHTITSMYHGTYTVSIDEDEPYEYSSSSMFEVHYGSSMTLVASVAEGYVFEGWWTGHEEEGEYATVFETDELLTENATLNYTPEDDVYLVPLSRKIIHVTVDVNGGNPINPNVFDGLEGQSLIEILMATGINPTHPSANKYLIGVCGDAECENELDMEAPIWEDTEIFLEWIDVVPHNLTYNLNYYGDERDIIEGVAYEGIDVDFIEDPEREGYVFKGWFEDPTCTLFFDGQGGIDEDTTIYADWGLPIESVELTVSAPQVGETVTVTYNEEFDVWEPSTVPDVSTESEQYVADHPDWVIGTCDPEDWDNHDCDELFEGTFAADTDYYARILVFAREGYAFTPETLENITVNGEAPAEVFGYWGTNDFQIIARVHTDNVVAYTVQFDTNGGEPIEPITRNAGTVMQLPIPNKEGWMFQEWQEWDEEDQPVGAYLPGDDYEFTMNETLHAYYTEDTGERTINFRIETGSGEMAPVVVQRGEEYEIPECEFTAPNGMTFGNWYYDDEFGRATLWPGDIIRVEGNLDLFVNWIGENEITLFEATVSGPVIGEAINTISINSSSEIYTAEIVDWCIGDTDELEVCEEPLSNDTLFEENQSYVVKVRFTITDGEHLLGWPIRVNVNDRAIHSWNYSGTVALATMVMEPTAGGEEPGPDPSDRPEFWSLDENPTQDNLEVTYGTDMEAFINERRQVFEESAGVHENLNYGPLFETNPPYKFAEKTGETWTLVCVNNQNEIVESENSCQEEGLRQGYTVVIHYKLWTVTKRTTVDVEFDTRGGSGVENQTIPGGTAATDPGETNKGENYVFVGWSVGEQIVNEDTGEMAQGGSFYEFGEPVMDNITLVANWKKIYDVDFDLGDILPSSYVVEPQRVVAGDTPEAPVATNGAEIVGMTYNAYAVEGFYTDGGFNNEYTGGPIVANTTLHVKWVDTLEGKTQVTTVSLTANSPVIGTVVEMQGNDWDTQTPQPDVSVPSGANYELWSEDGNYGYWVTNKSFNSSAFTGEMQANGTYYALIYLLPANENTVFGRDLTVTVNGTTVSANDINNIHNSLSILVTMTPVEVTYTILEGADQTHDIVADAETGLTVKASGDINDFTGIKVDNVAVDETNYSAVAGSTVVTLDPDYVNSLGVGNHTLTIEYTDGSVSTGFIVINSEAGGDDGGDDGGQQGGGQSDGTDGEDNPTTADTIIVWRLAFIASSIFLALATVKFKRQTER